MLRPVSSPALIVLLMSTCLRAAAPSVWLDVPFVKQEKNGCGAASVAMVMQFWQRQQGRALDAASDASQIQLSLYSSRGHGIYASDLERYLRGRGFRTFSLSGTTSDLDQHLQKGRPLIVALKPAGQSPLHYVVVTGVDTENHLVLLNDPAERKLLKEE